MLEEAAPAPDKVPCYVQQEPARKLKNLQSIPVLFMVGEGSYHRIYDHCLAKWLNQAGVKTEYVEMEKVGLPGNGHMMMLEKNSADIAKYIGSWLSKTARPTSGEHVSRATPAKTIPTFSTERIARKGFFFAGGSYWGEAGRQVMRGAMYTEVWVPRQVRYPYPIILFHANGQTGVDWQQTPDGRPGWAYRLVEAGYVVYMVDYPARGRSAYVPLPGPDGKTPIDGNLNIRTALELERIWTNARERGDFPAEDEPHAVAGRRQDRRSDLRQLHEVAGAVRRREHGAGARGHARAARHDRQSGDPVRPFAGRRDRASRSPKRGRSSSRRW